MALALSGILSGAIVTRFDLGARGPALEPPFANLHGGNPTGLPSYGGTFVSGGKSDGSFSSSERTGDAPERVIAFYEQSIDRTIWMLTSRGRTSLAFLFRADPRVRGGVLTSQARNGTSITLFVRDLKLPDGFPVDFPAEAQASVLGPGEITNGLAHLRWGVAPDGGPFIDGFAQILDDAGWQVITKSSTVRPPSLTCRSRERPVLSCRVVVSVEADPDMRGQFRHVADVWVGNGAEGTR